MCGLALLTEDLTTTTLPCLNNLKNLKIDLVMWKTSLVHKLSCSILFYNQFQTVAETIFNIIVQVKL